ASWSRFGCRRKRSDDFAARPAGAALPADPDALVARRSARGRARFFSTLILESPQRTWPP
ncbi:hypothetical protein, partial [Burkholderia territorii]|uniref:hypothetical protein n=1 Tax=Burkholderia territorii TaxID=1503055 RepID=UPI001BAA61E7